VTDHDRAMLLSVRPRYAESILAGTKRAEIRRQRPGVLPGVPLIIYATMPVGAVVGTARIGAVSEGSPEDLWQDHHSELGITRDEYDQYLHGVCVAYLLLLNSARRLTNPLTLSDMRESGGFQPPRSYRYVNHSNLKSLVNGHPAGSELLTLLRRELSPALW
jgi:predicted transcriptional regulator